MSRSLEQNQSFDYIRLATENRMLDVNSEFMARANISSEQLSFVLPGDVVAEDGSFFILHSGYTEPGLSVSMRQYSAIETIDNHPDDFKFEFFGVGQAKSAKPVGRLAVVSYLNTAKGFDGGEPLDTVATNASEAELEQIVRVVESPELSIVRINENATHSRTMISHMGDELSATHAVFLSAAGEGPEAVAFADRNFGNPGVVAAPGRAMEATPSIRQWLAKKLHRA